MAVSPMIYDVIVVGDVYRDIIMTGFASFPALGEEAFARDLTETIGGGAAITACGLAKLGTRVAVGGVVGRQDSSGIFQTLTAHGVDTTLLQTHPTEPSGMTVAVSTAGDRTFLSYAGANRQFPTFLRAEEIFEALATARHAHLACAPDPASATELVQQLHEKGSTVSLDAGWHESWLCDSATLRLLREIDIFFPNEREAKCITGKCQPHHMLDHLESLGSHHVALKLGTRGALSRVGAASYSAAPVLMNAVDTTGAGDAFDAGYLYGFLRHMPPGECLRIANLCGAFSTRERGGIAGLATREDLAANEAIVR